jgi:hypothetical protein
VADHGLCPILREDDNALNGTFRSCKTELVSVELCLRWGLPTPLRLHDYVKAGRNELDIGEAPVGGVVLLELDNDWRFKGSASGNTLHESPEDRIVAGQTPPEGESHVVLVPTEEVEDGVDAEAVKAKLDHRTRIGVQNAHRRLPMRGEAARLAL